MALKTPFKMTLPKKPGDIIDMMWGIDKKIDALNAKHAKALEPLNKQRLFIENHLLDHFPKDNLNGATGRLASAKIDKEDVPNAKDWGKTYAYIKKTGAFELLHKRLSTTACRERWKAKKIIPGVEKFTKLGIKLTAVKKRG